MVLMFLTLCANGYNNFQQRATGCANRCPTMLCPFAQGFICLTVSVIILNYVLN